MKVASCNARGLRQNEKRRMIFAYLHKSQYDIIFMQETHSLLTDEQRWRAEWGGTAIFSHGANSSRGVAVLFKNAFCFEIKRQLKDDHGRYILLEILVNNMIFSLVCIYGPNIDDPRFYRLVFNQLENLQCDNVICGGDFNFVFNLSLDKQGGAQKTNFKARDECLSFMDHFTLVDVWRERNPLSVGYSWSSNISNIRCRLDFFLISRNLLSNVTDCYFQPALLSDHSLTILCLTPSFKPRGRGYWKFNNSLLHDQEYIHLIENVITSFPSDHISGDIDPSLTWEKLKFHIRHRTVKYCKQKAYNFLGFLFI
ncbi:hypothetical protein HOLleu_26461 [Holothuria leucospilota]|uniref:exodeoxyribonuclease III n=1 Tax=Holothuria leucospilota TaxID=206669 RepID=A0A9Q1BP89_HOLLE|nr:hypothetical protein HOLleu_26461 [Holothuria leucospilota]